jgi:cysteine desulfurase
MTNQRIYADYNASSPLREGAKSRLLSALELTGNSSSIHQDGQKLRRIVEQSRREINAYLGNVSGELIFTSGATESAQLAIESAIAMGFENVFLNISEHDAIYKYAYERFSKISLIPNTKNGIIDIEWLEKNIANVEKPLIILMAVNNETGVIQPIKQASNMARLNNGAILVDAVQALGKIDPSQFVGFADWIILSGHKIGATVGIGAIIYAPGILPASNRPGGGQEKSIRSGTLNAQAIAGFAGAIDEISQNNNEIAQIKYIRDEFEKKLKLNFINPIIIGENTPRIGNTSCVALDILAEHLVIALDLDGISISSGSACSSGSTKVSRAIIATNITPEVAKNSIRISFGYKSTIEDADKIIAALVKTSKSAKKVAA